MFMLTLPYGTGGIGQPLSLLLKMDPLVSSLSLYDIRGAPGVAADISHVDVAGEVRTFYFFDAFYVSSRRVLTDISTRSTVIRPTSSKRLSLVSKLLLSPLVSRERYTAPPFKCPTANKPFLF